MWNKIVEYAQKIKIDFESKYFSLLLAPFSGKSEYNIYISFGIPLYWLEKVPVLKEYKDNQLFWETGFVMSLFKFKLKKL